ncbi:fimbrial biogenesis chaperone [Klebsiella grimontii]|uniref:fimbrial biogenesis chaperone n=1 Tax=Klebsiella grimontii TaxID=2058152 RepID=UPI002244A5DD|nr:molecular chaperone [Klebsiella grimontii]
MKTWRAGVAAVLLMTLSATTQAGVVVGGTRLIYEGGKKEASINLSNPDQNIYLIQSWVDSESRGKGAQAEKAPFIVTPPLFRLDSNQQNILRIVRAGGNLPEDKESLFWLNIKSIPSAEKKENTLQIAVKTRIKLIFRPSGVKSTLDEAATTLTWKRAGNQIQVTNPSSHYITFFNVKINGTAMKNVTMVAPRSAARFDLPANIAGGSLSWQFINDYGGASKTLTASL